MGRQHRFVSGMHTRGEDQGADFANPGPTLERIAFWVGVGTGAVCVVVFILAATGVLK